MKYRPHLIHHLFPILAILVSAVLCYLLPSWQTVVAFIAITIISSFIARWIMIIGIIQSEEDYWMWVGEAIRKLQQAEPDIWEALGFKSPPKVSHISIDKVEKNTSGSENPYYTTTYANVPVSPAVLQVFSDGILSGRKTLSETAWKGVIAGPKYRDFQDWMERHKLIAKVNPSAPTQGYILTEAGEQWLLKHASNGVGGEAYIRKIPVRSDKEVV